MAQNKKNKTMTIVKIRNLSNNPSPEYQTEGSAGMDLRAQIDSESIVLEPGERVLIKTGISFQLPKGVEAQIRPRSGLALKHGITVLNSPGTIDSDYTGDVGVILVNQSTVPFVINNGDRIAQCVFAKYEQVNFVPAIEFTEEENGRGQNGFGSTGVK